MNEDYIMPILVDCPGYNVPCCHGYNYPYGIKEKCSKCNGSGKILAIKKSDIITLIKEINGE